MTAAQARKDTEYKVSRQNDTPRSTPRETFERMRATEDDATEQDAPPEPAGSPRLRAANIAMGLRVPGGRMAEVLAWTALGWSAFQLWVASPLPELIGFGVNSPCGWLR